MNFRVTRLLPLALVFALCFSNAACNSVTAGEYNTKINVGDVAPEWSGLIGVDEETHSSTDTDDSPAVLVVFTCNSCPYAVDLEDRLLALHSKLSSKRIAVVAINVNKVEEDSLSMMQEKASKKNFKFPYLFDPTQAIAKEFGAGYTPECFVLDGDRKIVYMGSFDDSPDGSKVSKKYVEDAISAVLAGTRPTVTETVPIGCRIRFERERRTRRKSSE